MFAATLTGRIVDAKTGEPVAKAEVIATGTGQRVRTDDKGGFTLTLAAGDVELYVTTVGYGLVKKTVRVVEEPSGPIEIALEQETAVRKDAVTVSAGPFDGAESNAASEATLSKAEIQALAMVLIGDPLRAAQALPGVAGNNDFRAEFAVRGARYEQVAIYVDGVLTDGFVHSANLGVGGVASSEKVSLTAINADNVSEISLLPGAFPSKYGGSSAAVLNLQTREGNFVRPVGRFATGLLGISGVVDGPFAHHKGSWLVSGRTSYADYLQRFIERISGTGQKNEDKSSLDFTDAQARGTYNLSQRQQVGISGTYGIFRASDPLAPGTTDLEEIVRLTSENLLVNGFWRYTAGPHTLLEVRGFSLTDSSRDKNRNAGVLDDRRRTQDGFRADASWVRGSQNIEAGVYVRAIHQRSLVNGYRPAATVFEAFDKKAEEDSYYAQDTWRKGRASITAGGRVAHTDLTGQTTASPRVAVSVGVKENWTMRAGAGSYTKFPEMERVFGFFGNAKLRADEALHYNFSVERRLGRRTRILGEFYDREDRRQAFAFYEPLLVNGTGTIYGLPYRNVVRGHARGAEMTLQRRSANGLTGWLSYAYAKTAYVDAADGLRFPSDFDQRHTVTAFGSYRFRPTFDVSSQWRYGSGVPVPGFIHYDGRNLELAAERNASRLPEYGRLDVRANKAFLFKKWKLTLSAEVLNVLNRANVISISTDPIRIFTSGRFRAGLESSFGRLPSISIAFSF